MGAEQAAAETIDVATATLVLISLAFGVFMALWGFSRNAASIRDVATIQQEVAELKHDFVDLGRRLASVELTIVALPTHEHVHQLDVRLERVTTVVEATARQIDRVYDHMLATSPATEGHGEK